MGTLKHLTCSPRLKNSISMRCFVKPCFLFVFLAMGTAFAAAASDEEFGVWMKDDMCLNTNISLSGQPSFMITTMDQATCCRNCENQEVCSVEMNTSKIICGYNPTMEQVCVKAQEEEGCCVMSS